MINLNDSDLKEIDNILEKELYLTDLINAQPNLKEIYRAGIWLSTQLKKHGADDTLIVQFGYTFGQLAFRQNPWETAEKMFEDYKSNNFTIEKD